MSTTITIGGDFFPNNKYGENQSITHSPESLWGDTLAIWQKSGLSIVNLEAPITKSEEPIFKTGPNNKALPEAVKTLQAADINLVTLANNHILDYGIQGLNETLQICKTHSINTVGAHHKAQKAQEPFLIEIDGHKIAIINFAENEWANADAQNGGANSLNIIDNLAQIKNARQKAEFVFVIIHGGHEHCRYASPRMIKTYRFFAENGADAIIGHHAHCVNGFEIHQGVPIFYNLGNLFFPSQTAFSGWYEGMLVQFNIAADKSLSWEILPYKQCQANSLEINLLKGAEKDSFLRDLEELNRIIAEPAITQKMWQQHCQTYEGLLTQIIVPFSFLAKIINKFKLYRFLPFKKHLALILNLSRCEAHKDLIEYLINRRLKK